MTGPSHTGAPGSTESVGAITTRDAPPLLAVDDLSVSLPGPHGVVHAVRHVSFGLQPGATLGIVGESGSGKSMLARALVGVTPTGSQVAGRIMFHGRDLRAEPRERARRVLGTGMAMVFQDPMTSLNPVVRIDRQLTEAPMKHLGLGSTAARQRAISLLEQVGIPDPVRRLRQYPHQLSGGMRQRVTIAMALACDPDLLIADEVTTALDVTVQKQILDLLGALQRERGMAVIMISHDLGVVAGRTDEVAVMYAGRLVEYAPTREIFRHPRHRYTQALLDSIPRLDHPRHHPLTAIEGSPPDLTRHSEGCAFAPRCPAVVHRCRQEQPRLDQIVGHDHRHACFVPLGPAPADSEGDPP